MTHVIDGKTYYWCLSTRSLRRNRVNRWCLGQGCLLSPRGALSGGSPPDTPLEVSVAIVGGCAVLSATGKTQAGGT